MRVEDIRIEWYVDVRRQCVALRGTAVGSIRETARCLGVGWLVLAGGWAGVAWLGSTEPRATSRQYWYTEYRC